MFFIDLDFVIINMFLLLVFTVAGMLVNKGYSYFKCSLACVLAFSFIEGARYMRGNDYAHYLDVYNYNLEDGQKLYTWFCDFLKFCGVPDYLSFFFYALVFSTCLFVFLYRFRKNAHILFPVALIALLFFHEFMIRQELSYSFVFLYLTALFNIKTSFDISNHKLIISGKKTDFTNMILCIVFAFCTISIHSANIFVLLLLTFLYVFRIKAIDWKIAFPLLLFAAYVIPHIFDFSILEPALNVLTGSNEKLSGYSENFDFWFSKDAFNDGYTRKTLVLIFEMLGNGVLMYLFCRANRQLHFSPKIVTLYNGYIFGTVFMNAFRNLEILNRMGYVFFIWWFIPFFAVIVSCRYVKFHRFEKYALLSLTFFLYDYLKYIFVNDTMTLFLWDALDVI